MLWKDYAFTRSRLTRVKLHGRGRCVFSWPWSVYCRDGCYSRQPLQKTNEMTASWLKDKWLQGDTGSNTNTFICISVFAFQI